MTATVQTVLGEIPASELGLTLVHEHVFLDMYEVTVNGQLVLLDERRAVQELGLFRERGGVTVVDQTCHGIGPAPVALQRAAERSGVQVVASTGVYWERFHPSWLQTMTEDDIARMFVRELAHGIGESSVRAHVIAEIGTHHRAISAAEATVLRAAAKAQLETGAPIATHALFTDIGLRQLEVLTDAGAEPARILIGHADTAIDLDYHRALLGAGAWIGYDSFGQTDKASDAERVEALSALIAEGWGAQLVVSNDVCKKGALTAFGGGGYGHVIAVLPDLLAARGLGADILDMLLVTNPARFLAGE